MHGIETLTTSLLCAAACADPDYRSALASAGFSNSQTVSYGGRTFNHDDIAQLATDAYIRHRPEFPMVCGGSPAKERKRQRQFKRCCANDVGTTFGLSPMTILFAVVMAVLGGPFGLVLAIVTVLFEYYLTKDLDGDKAIAAAAMGAA